MTFTTPRAEPKHDRFGRYLLLDPDTGKERAYTRVTTFAKTLSDMYGLGKWQERMVAKGIATRADLYALAAATPVDDKAQFDRICTDAKEAAKATSGANLGTALHAFTEQVDRGDDVTVPQPWDRDINAYRAELAQHQLKVRRDWIERIVLIPQYGLAGTLDRIYGTSLGHNQIGDVKTGKTLEYSWCEIAIQLALYANAKWLIDPASGQAEPMPDIDQDQALVMHLPAGAGSAQLYTVDIKAGWEAAYICRVVRDWRSRKDLAAPTVTEALPPTPALTLTDRINNAIDMHTLEQLWRDNRGIWLPAHTTAASLRRKHIATLNSAGTPGGTREEEGAHA